MRIAPLALLAAILALLPALAGAGEWRPGDGIRYVRGCHTIEAMIGVLEAWEAGRVPDEVHGSQCFGVAMALPAVLVQSVGRTYRMEDGTRVRAWIILDAMGDTEAVYLHEHAGPHEATGA